ncbi:UNVERIFIED_CONTAM: hypothetical protein GTU68_066001 [Idotea baltica]|nr:hypothetical protein [Idotea baltica]
MASFRSPSCTRKFSPHTPSASSPSSI